MFRFNHSTAWGCGAVLILVSLGQAMWKAPLLRMVELNLCRSYYETQDPKVISPNGDVDERFCKVLPVQKELATIFAYNILFTALIELLTAFPYATLCGRFNRRTVLLVNVGSAAAGLCHTMCICYFYQIFSTRLIWAQCIYRLFGGGESVLLSLTNALIAETIPAANLSKALFSLNAARLFVNAASQTLGARLMQKSIWLPMSVGISIYSLVFPVLFLIIDPRHQKYKSPSEVATKVTVTVPSATIAGGEETDPLLDSSISSGPSSGPSRPAISVEQRHNESPLYMVWNSFTSAFLAVIHVCRNPIAAPTLVLFFWNELGHGVNTIIPQWASCTFSWTLADTNYFLAAQRAIAAITLVVLTLIIHWLQAIGKPAARLDLGLVIFCQSATLLGMFCTIASSLYTSARWRNVQYVCAVLLYMMGWGMNGALQSTVTRAIDPDHITLVYTGLNVAERLATMTSGPVFAALLAEGLERGGVWEYLPYWVSLGFFLIVSVLTVRLVRMLAKV
ncbi:hypothetical protein P153DRAFT_386400 [Dothidotthia symphoricarpi CBS 119687]|uniref:MFS general substrate transporter n=1 Tax=Dothidotthia symphoricarpi CBS 119687 TaxID=1392245 RepID=A0A6A6AAM8_9PLEO|nr:uncharacterized protein P153DRAFT_386400 [Dothidotthia symphoricarpi CBS 119687]KAF2128273.1 hypothetical protein P153DRAFT_386400 [Dothidotthia symphoricarpi CBS 119687]